MGEKSGGGSSTTITSTSNNYDPESSRRLAAIAERQQDISEEQYAYFKEVFEPYITQAIDYSRAVLPTQAEYNKSVMEAQQSLLGLRTELTQKVLQEQARDVDVNRALRDAAREEQMREIQRSSIAADRFYDEAVKGVDVEQRLEAASADVTQAFTQAQAQTGRAAARMGISPRGVDITSGGLESAKALAGARTQVRRTAEQENFARLTAAMQARGRGIPTVPDVSGQQAVPYTPAQPTIGDQYRITDPSQTALGYSQAAAQGYGTLASRVMGTQGTQTGPRQQSGAWGQLAGSTLQAAGTLGAAYMLR